MSIANSTIRGNEIGLSTDGGVTSLDHVVFADNRRWDIEATRLGEVEWRHTEFEPSCSYIEGRRSHGCERGSLPQTPPVFILGLVMLGVDTVRAGIARLAVWLRLYSRIPKERLLDHPVRAEIMGLIAETPGIHQRELAREIGSYGKTVYHLQRLEAEEFVCSRVDGDTKRFYLPGEAEPGEDPTRERILRCISARPGIHARRIARRIGVSRQLVSYHVQGLINDGYIESVSGERRTELYPAEEDGGREGAPPAMQERPGIP